MRLAIVASHPIQYQAPWFRALARVTDLTVFFCHKQDAAGQAAAGFGVEFEWDTPLVDGYRFEFLENVALRRDVSSFSGCDTPGIDVLLETGGFEACLVCGWYLKSYLQAIRACRQLGIPVLSRGDSQLATPRSAVWSLAKHVPYRWLLQRIDAHLYVGAANREYLKHYGVPDDRLFFAPHFIDSDQFALAAERARASGEAAAVRREHNISDRALVFVFAGKLVARKRPADFIEAIQNARRAAAKAASAADIQGLVVGSGPLAANLRQLAEAHHIPVAFAGFQNQSRLPRYYAAADALILPSDGSETWGLVVNEAMACGLPAIVSRDAGCARDLIDEGRTGYSFPCGDVNALVDSMLLLAHALRAGKTGIREALQATVDRFSCDAAVAGTLEALDLVTATRVRRRASPAIAQA